MREMDEDTPEGRPEKTGTPSSDLEPPRGTPKASN